MLDELLGRADLKERLAALEEERDRLAARLDAEEERRTEAVHARNEAEERVNRLEDRVTELTDRVERAERDGAELAFRGTEDLRGERLEAVLDRLDGVDAGPEGALTAMVADDPPERVREAFGDRTPLIERAAPCLVYTDDAGLVSAALDPPVAPAPFVTWAESFRVDRSWFLPRGRHALALVRSDVFALGTYEGRERVAFDGFESDVKGKHGKGGFSQRRFERRRDEQIDAHVDRCRKELADAPEPLYVVGETSLLGAVDDLAAATAPADATGDPETALAAAVADFWTVRLHLV